MAASNDGRRDLAGSSELRESLDQVVMDGTRWLTTGLAAIFVAYIAFNLQTLDDPNVRLVTMHDTALLVIFVALTVAQVRKRLPLYLANPLIAAIAVLVVSNVLFTVLTYGDPSDLGYLPLILIGPGSFMLSYRWLFLSLAAVVAAAVPVAWVLLGQPEFTNFCFGAFAGAAISTGIHAHRLRTQRHLVAMRLKEVEQAASLKDALEAVETELSERKRTEARRKQLEEQLRQAQKMEAVGLLAGGIAHDMNNVLGAITALASTLKDEAPAGDRKRAELGQILAAAQRGSEFTRNLLGFARKGKYEKRELSVNRTIGDVERLLVRTIPKRISLEVRLADDLDSIEGDPIQITQVLMNLCLNSVDATADQGRLTIATENVVLDPEDCSLHPNLEPGRYVRVVVEDTGWGIESTALDRVFDPFYTTKPSGEGTGLGLSMVYGTIRNHGGDVSIASEPGRGTRVTLLLPGLPYAGPSEVSASPTGEVEVGSGMILLIDDEAIICASATRLLKSLGYDVLVASDGRQALDIYREHRDRILLVILDMNMPVMGGSECYAKLRELDPAVRVLISSGFADSAETETLLEQGAAGFLGKPYERSAMAQAITDALTADRSGTWLR